MTDARIGIRVASFADAPRVANMVEQYWSLEDMSGFDLQTITRQLEHVIGSPGIGSVIVAADDERLFGYLITVYVFSLEHLGITAEIDELFVEPGNRSRGVGSALLAVAEQAARSAGCTNLSLQIADRNRRAREFYLRQGFAPRRGYALLEKNIGDSG